MQIDNYFPYIASAYAVASVFLFSFWLLSIKQLKKRERDFNKVAGKKK